MSPTSEREPLLGRNTSRKPGFTSLVLTFIALALSVFVASLDETIVATAALRIVSDFEAFHVYSWVSVAYLVCLNAAQPLYGRVSDVFGRRAAILFGIIVFLLGSVGCGLAPNVELFLMSRCVAGIGAGGLTGMAFIVVADIFPLEERPKYQSILMSAYGAACICGPVLGGVITNRISWRWCFWINIPVCIAALLAILAFLRLPKPHVNVWSSLKKIDFAGAATLVVAVVCFMLSMTFGGKYWKWDSPPIYIAVAASILSLVAFIIMEKYYAAEPIVPLHLFRNRSLVGSWISLFFYGMVFFSFMYYLPVWFGVVEHSSIEMRGVQLIPMLIGLVTAGVLQQPITQMVARIVTGTPPTKVLAHFGSVLFIIGTILRVLVTKSTSKLTESAILLFLGLGSGLASQTFYLCAQASVNSEDLAVASSLSIFSENLGGSVGLSISATVQRIELGRRFDDIPEDIINHKILALILRNPSLVHQPGYLSDELREIVVDSFVGSLLLTFRVCIAFAVVTFFTGFLLKHTSSWKKPEEEREDVTQ